MSAVAPFPDLINSVFLTKEKNDAGIHAVRFFIRGKPWVVDVDDRMFYYIPIEDGKQESLIFARSKNGYMWGPILEKIFAKMKGSYMNSDGGK